MPANIRKSFNGIGIIPTGTLASDTMGELEVLSSDGTLNYYNGTVRKAIVTQGTTSLNSVTSASSLATVGTITTGTWNATTIDVAHGGTGQVTLTQHGVLIGNGTSGITQLGAAAVGTVLNQLTASADPVFTTSASLGSAGASQGSLAISGATSGTVTIQVQPAAGTYNFNLPIGAGTTGQPLLSGGASNAMTFGTLSVGAGGTGQTTLTSHGVLVGNGTSSITQLSAAAAGTLLTGQGTGSDPSFSATPTLGVAGTTLGTLSFSGSTSGTVTVKPQAAAGTYNFNLPITAGNSGEVLTSAGGGASVMTWSSVLSNPMTTLGDIIYENSTPAPARLAGNTTTTKQYLSQTGNGSISAAPSWAQVAFADISGTASSSQVATATFVAPTIQKFTSGSGTYTTPTSPRTPLYIRVRMVGGGGGGGATGYTGAGASANGVASSFGSSLLTANPGHGGASTGVAVDAAGGTASLGSGPIGTALTGGSGGGGSNNQASSTLASQGGNGGNSAFGGSGGGGEAGCGGNNGNAGAAASANTGSGGGGAGGGSAVTNSGTGNGAQGGGAGGFVDAIITSPTSSYSYVVGSGGAGGTAGTNGVAGGAGGSGYIEITEYYQ